MASNDDEQSGVQVLGSAEHTRVALLELFEWAHELRFSYAWMSSAQGTADHWRAFPITKVRRGVVGLHFAETEPLVL
ncbi:hypothetical protein DB30_05456 [Enhygromyxa salina]|uniref:Uncharacterized protein n=1 Tax=Enhygromyxa salina TaxID=215803 RepID=A0A0C2D6B2_9BACT|nr:hypothetical protein [Enhygromyxa salina]KIG15582.1 hypothetical protein DB30_05456 [Enhygromyxa salina]